MKNPAQMSDRELQSTLAQYLECPSRGVGDEIYISLLEAELAKREAQHGLR